MTDLSPQAKVSLSRKRDLSPKQFSGRKSYNDPLKVYCPHAHPTRSAVVQCGHYHFLVARKKMPVTAAVWLTRCIPPLPLAD